MDKNASAQIVSTAIRLQASRTLKRDVAGLDKTHEGQEFAKAIAEGAAAGMTPQEVVGEVVKAMGGNQGMALDILTAVEELAKAHVEQHTRTLANGKTVNVKAYENARTASMKGTTLAHGATFRAMKDKTPESHENAARMHEQAAKQHGEAHEVHPMDVPEVGKEHASLKGQHQMAAEYHKGEAATLRNGEEYQRAKGKADIASNLSTHAGTGKDAAPRHREAAALHQKAHDLNPAAGHDATAGKHEALAAAHSALDQSLESPHRSKARYDAQDASAVALHATQQAHMGEGTPEAHAKAAQLHGKAAEAHMALHGAHESDEDGHHGKIAQDHMKAHAYHSKLAKKDQPVAKAEGTMTSSPTTTDLAEKKGGEALALEGGLRKDAEDEDEDAKGASMTGTIGKAEVRPPGENPHAAPGAVLGVEAMVLAGGGPGNPGNNEITKAQVEAHTRTQGGKIVQVSAYDNHYVASGKASSTAHAATAAAKNPQGHSTAAASHMTAAAGHREAAKYAPEDWQKKGHEDNAKLHEHYAQAHHAKAKAADLKADTGVDQPKHTAQDIKELENHDHFLGFGYHGHSNRTEITDEQVAEAANRANIDKHELAAHLLSKSGRHMMDGHDGGTDHESAVAKFQRHLSSAKNAKEYGIKEYAKELEGMAKPKPIIKTTNDGLTHAQRTAGASKDPGEKERFHAADHDSEVAYATGSPESHARAHKSHTEALAQATTPEIKAHHEKYAGIHKEKMGQTPKQPEGSTDKSGTVEGAGGMNTKDNSWKPEQHSQAAEEATAAAHKAGTAESAEMKHAQRASETAHAQSARANDETGHQNAAGLHNIAADHHKKLAHKFQEAGDKGKTAIHTAKFNEHRDAYHSEIAKMKEAKKPKDSGGVDHLSIAKKHMGQDLETLDERKSDRLDFHDISKTAASRMVSDAFKQGSGGKEPTEEQIHAAYKEATTHEGSSHGFDHLKDEGRDHLDFKEHHVSAIKRMIETGHKHGKAAK